MTRDPWSDVEVRQPGCGVLPASDQGANEQDTPAPVEPVRRLRDRVLTREALRNLPQPRPLIENTLDRDTVGLVVGYHGTGKTFLAFDWSCCVATGKPWQGRPVIDPGPVLYLAGEGVHGLDRRVDAWEHAWGREATDLHVLPFTVNLRNSADVAELAEVARELDVRLVVIDTLARSLVGADENSARDIGEAVAALDRLRRATGATVLPVHHTGKDKTTTRGSSALEAAVDTVYAVEGDGRCMRLSRTKRKDGPRDDFHALALRPTLGSCVVEHSHEAVGVTADLSASSEKALEVLWESFGSTGATAGQWLEATGLPSTSFYRARNDLLSKASVVNRGTDSRPRYWPADEGLNDQLPPTPTPTPTPAQLPLPPTTPRGGSDGSKGRNGSRARLKSVSDK